LVQSCERRERLERTARTRLQSDNRRLQELNRTLREQVEVLQQQLIVATTQQQQQLSSTGRNQQDLLIAQLIQQNKELVDANKRQYIEIQAQSATLEEQRIHINVLDSALKRLEEEVRQKQLYQKQLQSLLGANERRDKLRQELENELSKDLNRAPSSDANLKWQLREKEQMMRLEAERSVIDDSRQLSLQQGQDNEAHLAQRKVNELTTRLKLVENRLAEKEKEDIIRQLQEQKRKTISFLIQFSTNLYFSAVYVGSVGNSYGLLNNNDCYSTPSSSIVSSTPTTPLIYNTTNYDNLMPSSSSSKTVSGTSNTSFDALLAGAYLYQPNYGQKISSVPPNGISPNTSCSSSSTMQQQHQHQQPSTVSSNTSNYLNYDQSLDEQRKSIDDQLKKLDNQLLTKVSELTLIQQQHIQLQQKQNLNLKSKNAALIHNSRASSLSLCANSGSVSRSSNNKSVDVTNNLKAQNTLSNSMQSLPITYSTRLDIDDDNDDEEEQEIFY
jgi:angiomotin like